MVRCIGLCKKALLRDKGPEKRAGELKIDEIDEERWRWCPKDKSLHHRPAVEPHHGGAGLQDSEVNSERTRGKENLVLLRFDKCTRDCPWALWKDFKTQKDVGNKDIEWMFVDQKGKHLTKAKTVQGWKELSNVMVSGHSARRSGAMAYVRVGLPIQELAFLGRWKSSVVLRYAEDALQDVPANEKCKVQPFSKPKKPAKINQTETKHKEPEGADKTTSNVAFWVASNNYKRT